MIDTLLSKLALSQTTRPLSIRVLEVLHARPHDALTVVQLSRELHARPSQIDKALRDLVSFTEATDWAEGGEARWRWSPIGSGQLRGA